MLHVHEQFTLSQEFRGPEVGKDVGDILNTEHGPLDLLAAHTIDHEPRCDVLKHLGSKNEKKG